MKRLKDFVSAARAQIEEIEPEGLDELIENHDDVLIVDVREPYEYDKGHIPGAINVPRGVLEGAADPAYTHRVDTLCEARARTVVLYCQTGGRSAMATFTLGEMGFERAVSLAGGIELWRAEGMAVVAEKPSAATGDSH